MTGNIQTREPVFGRGSELAELSARLSSGKGFLLHGPAGIGKSLLIRKTLDDFPKVLYCSNTKSPQSMFRSMAESLLSVGDSTTKSLLKRASISSKSAVSLKGIVLDSLRISPRAMVLDQLVRPSQALGAAVREIVNTGSQIVSVARSAHMEDAGYVLALYAFREERFEIHPFDTKVAEEFAVSVASKLEIDAENRQEFLSRVLEYAKGNPGVIVALLRKGAQPKYRAGDHIKIVPLYIDFRLEWNGLM